MTHLLVILIIRRYWNASAQCSICKWNWLNFIWMQILLLLIKKSILIQEKNQQLKKKEWNRYSLPQRNNRCTFLKKNMSSAKTENKGEGNMTVVRKLCLCGLFNQEPWLVLNSCYWEEIPKQENILRNMEWIHSRQRSNTATHSQYNTRNNWRYRWKICMYMCFIILLWLWKKNILTQMDSMSTKKPILRTEPKYSDTMTRDRINMVSWCLRGENSETKHAFKNKTRDAFWKAEACHSS